MIGTDFTTIQLILAGVGIGVIFGGLILGISKNFSLKGQLFSYAILGFAFAEVTGLSAIKLIEISVLIDIFIYIIIPLIGVYLINLKHINPEGHERLNKNLYVYSGFFTLTFWLIVLTNKNLVSFIFILYSTLRLGYYIDWHLFVENNVIQDLLFMEPGASLEGDTSKQYPHSAIREKGPPKRSIDDVNTTINTVFTRDDGVKTTSRDPKDWGWNVYHDFSSIYSTRSHHCEQMANLLDYHCKVHGRRLVDTCYDLSPYLSFNATEFFDSFTEPFKLPNAPMSSKLANNQELRDLFRKESFKFK